MSAGPLKKQRRNALVWRGGLSPACRMRFFQTSELPSHFAQAASTITEEAIAQEVICGPDPTRHIAAITQAAEAGYTHVWVHQIGPDQAGFFKFYAYEVLSKLHK